MAIVSWAVRHLPVDGGTAVGLAEGPGDVTMLTEAGTLVEVAVTALWLVAVLQPPAIAAHAIETAHRTGPPRRPGHVTRERARGPEPEEVTAPAGRENIAQP